MKIIGGVELGGDNVLLDWLDVLDFLNVYNR
jgi:hypothetical protein